MLALVLFSAVFVFAGHSRVRIERSFAPQVVPPGQMSHATVRITNLSVLPCLEAKWSDDLPPGISGDASGILPALGGSHGTDSRVSFSYALQGLRRGRHPIGPLRVNVLDPFGLVFRRHKFGSPEPLTVLPRRVDLRPIAPRGTSEDGATRPAPQHVGLGEDDVIARSYLPGDAMKRLHWKATAHRGELMVRQEEQQLTPRAAVILDCEPVSQGTAQDRQGVWEYSVRLRVVHRRDGLDHGAPGQGRVRRGAAVQRDAPSTGSSPTGRTPSRTRWSTSPWSSRSEHDNERLVAPERAAFMLLGRVSVERAHYWVHVMSTSRAVLALVAANSSAEARGILEDARWRIVTYQPNQDISDVWTEFDGARAHAAG